MNTSELKPCPFCGSTDIRGLLTFSYIEIMCGSCQASITRGLVCGKYETLGEARDDFVIQTIEAWNRRVDNDR